MAEMTQAKNDSENPQGEGRVSAPLLNRNIPYDQPWLTSLLRPVLIAILVVCLDLVIMAFIARLVPELSSNYVPVILVISVMAVLIGCVTTTLLAQPVHRHRRAPAYRLAEVGLLLALTRLAIWFVTGTLPTIMEFLVHPLDTLFDGLFIVGGLIVAFSWIIATDTTDDLLRLALQPDELYAMQMDRIGEMVRTSNSDRPSILRRVVGRWVGGGILMVLLAASLRLGPSSHGFFALARQNIQPSVIGAVVIYFLTGLLLVSQGQLAVLRSRWTIDRVPNAANVLRNWPLYVLGLIGLIGGVAILLPFGSTFYLAQILGALLSFIFNTLFGILQFLMLLFMLLISLLTGKAPPPPAEKPPAQPPPQIVPPAAQPNHLPVWAGGALFWVTMLLLLGYAAYIYFSGRGVNFAWLRALWQALRERWLQLFGAYQDWQEARIRTRRGATITPDAAEHDPFGSWWQRRKLDPNQQVRYLYLSLLHTAAKYGLPRAEAETPLRYAPRLAQEIVAAQQRRLTSSKSTGDVQAVPLPADEAQDKQAQNKEREHSALPEIQTLTDAFIRVRYATRSIEAGEVPRLQQIWQKIKQQLLL